MLPQPDPFAPITLDNIKSQIGLVQNFFLAKLHANNDQPLVEDEDLPQKHRLPKPRLPPTGKITSPRKRTIKEPGPGKGHPKKKMKLNDGEAKETGNDASKTGSKGGDNPKVTETKKDADKANAEKPPGETAKEAAPSKPLTNGVGPSKSSPAAQQPQESSKKSSETPNHPPKTKEKLVNGESGGMISPESLEA